MRTFCTDYDQIVAGTGCSGSPDTLRCLRHAPYAQLKAAADATPDFLSYQVCHYFEDSLPTLKFFQSLRLAWLPRVDGVFLTDNPQTLVQKGQIAPIPMISGEHAVQFCAKIVGFHNLHFRNLQ